jgi:hypothetical protein
MNRLRNLVNLKVLVGGGFVTICLFVTLLVLLNSARQDQPGAVSGTVVFYIIAAPTATPLAPLASVTPIISPTQPMQDATPNGTFTIGAYVEIAGTGGDGLRLRADPGLSGMVRFLAIDGEVFQVMDGPLQVDGFTWWLLQALYNPSVQGWAVDNFLIVVQNP